MNQFQIIFMNLSTLRTLQAVLVHGNFTAAGVVVGCTPSAVSVQIKQLEQYFGRPLFNRSTRAVVATPFAKEVGAAASSFLERIESLRAQPSMAVEGKLRFGVMTSMQSELLPLALGILRERHPALEIKVPPLNDPGELLAALRSGQIDVGLLARPESGGSTRLGWHDLLRQPYVMLAPANTSDLDAGQLLERYGWISYEPGIAGGRVAARTARALIPGISPILELRSIDAIVSMVAAGIGVAILPKPRNRLLAAYGVQLIGLGRTAPSRQISLAWRQSDGENRKIAALCEAFEEIKSAAA